MLLFKIEAADFFQKLPKLQDSTQIALHNIDGCSMNAASANRLLREHLSLLLFWLNPPGTFYRPLKLQVVTQIAVHDMDRGGACTVQAIRSSETLRCFS